VKLVLEIATLVLALAGVVLLVFALRHRAAAPEPAVEPTDLDRRRFLNRALLGSLGMFGAAFGAGSLSFIWPKVPAGKFGGWITVGKYKDIVATIKREKRPLYHPVGQFYVVRYENDDPENRYVQAGVVARGLMAISQKCSHLGCRVPYCPSSGYFECPCHDAYFNGAGEVLSGVAPAGMWRYPIEITPDGSVVVDTKSRIAQPPRGTETIERGPSGPLCVGPS
jgi:cytochrome b6-f complex iron-sulfur subunit